MAGRRHKPFPIVIRHLEVAEAYDVTPLMRRVVLTGGELGAFHNNGFEIAPFRTENADDHVKLILLDPDDPSVGTPTQNDGFLDWPSGSFARTRDYTPRRYDPASRRLELDFVKHRGGLAADWAERVRPGDRVHIAGPRGTTVLPEGIEWYFLVGDETALPAIARRVEELPAGTPVTAIVSVPSASEEQEFDHRADLHLTWVHRDTTGPDVLMEAIEAAPWREGRVYAWAAGEAEMLRPVRRWFKRDRQVAPEYTDIAGYWRAGKSQLEAAREIHRLQDKVDLALPYAVRAAVTLDLAELVVDGHTTVDSLAAAAGADPRGIRKLLRLLAHERLFTLSAEGTIGLTSLGSVLIEDHLHDRYDHRNGYARIDDPWPGLLHSLRTGTSGFEHVKGRTFWAELSDDERLGTTFDRTLAQGSYGWAPRVAEQLALTDEHVVDVGGGSGALLAAVLTAYPKTLATLVELPTTAERGRAHLTERGLADRVRISGQSFFAPLPAGGDIYLLAQVLHDWPDAEAVAILTRLAEVAGESTRVVLVEHLPAADDHDHDLAFDLQMYATFGGGERDEHDLAALAGQAGLVVHAVRPVHERVHTIELRTAPRG